MNPWKPVGILLGVLFTTICILSHPTEAAFGETLTVFPLAHHGHVALLFNFTIDWDSDASGRHFGLCPKALCGLIVSQKLDELNLKLTKGRWNYEKWGNSPLPAPQGAELTAFYDESVVGLQSDGLWRSTTMGLAGQFCASLEHMYSPISTSSGLFSPRPITSFKLEGQTSLEEPNVRQYCESGSRKRSARVMRHSILYGETVCTENLTPWMKLLPCRSEAGLAKYLSNPSHLFNFDYISLGVHVRPSVRPSDPKTLQMTLVLVVDRKLPPVSAAIQSFQPPASVQTFDLQRFLGVQITQRHICPLSTSSNLIVHRPITYGPDSISSSCFPEATVSPSETAAPLQCNLLELKHPWNLALQWNNTNIDIDPIFQGFVTAHRWLVGWGQQNGKLALEIHNNLRHSVSIKYRQITPFMLRLMFHTAKVRVTDLDTGLELQIKPSRFSAEPGQDRLDPTNFDLHIQLPPRSKLSLTVNYDLVFLHWMEHPPDAHRGFDVSAGIVLVSLSKSALDEIQGHSQSGVLVPSIHKCGNAHCFLVYTEGLVLSLPTPDFSMPYNVITLTSTVIAILFAFTVKTLTRRYSQLFKDGSFASDRVIVIIIRKFLQYFKKGQRPVRKAAQKQEPVPVQ